jgi:hypothetical protein
VLLCSDPHCARGSIIWRSSLDAELACGADLKTLTRCQSHWLETCALRRARPISRPSFCAWLRYMEALALRRPHLGQRSPLCEGGPALPEKIGFVLQYVRGGRYCSPRMLCRFDLVLSANSTSWRIASEREGLSGCCFAQVSIADLNAGERRIADTGSLPVAGRPRFLFGSTFFVDTDCIFR